MVAVLLVTAAWLPALWGWGALVARVLGARSLGLATTGLLGLAALAATGTLVHFVAPLTPAISAVAFAAGLAAFARDARRLTEDVPAASWVGMALVLAAVAASSAMPVRHYDMALYWLQAVRWTTDSAHPLGIATLHGRLGLNSTWFAVCALLEHPLAVGESGVVAPAVVLVLGAWLVGEGVREILNRRGSAAGWLAVSTAVLVATASEQLGGHSPDLAAAIVGFAALVAWARAFEDGDGGKWAGAAVVLSAFAITVKLSAGIWIVAAPALWSLGVRRGDASRSLARASAAAAALLVPWIGSGYLASGCPLFPSSVGCLSLPWTTPASIGRALTKLVTAWGRIAGRDPDLVLAGWDWVPMWATRIWHEEPVRVVGWTLPGGVVAMLARRRKPSAGVLPLMATCAAGVAFWFLTAPASRFGWAYLFGLAFVPAAETAARMDERPARWPSLLVGAAALLAVVVITGASLERTRSARGPFSLVQWPDAPAMGSREVETLSGLRVRMPALLDLCGAAPIPCTPFFDPGLSLDGRVFRTSTVSPNHP